VQLVIASVFVEGIGGGVSLRQMTEEIRALLAEEPSLLARFDAVFYATLGSSWQEAMEERFDAELALDSLRFFDSLQVPKIDGPIPLTVSDIRFTSDLSGAPSMDTASMRESGGLFAAALDAG
jgi:hypothetical protein